MCSPFYSVVTFLFHRLFDLVVAHPFAFAFTLLEYICFFCLSDEEYYYEEHNGEYDGWHHNEEHDWWYHNEDHDWWYHNEAPK